MYRIYPTVKTSIAASIECETAGEAVALLEATSKINGEANGHVSRSQPHRGRPRKAVRQNRTASESWAHARKIAEEQGREDVAQVRSEIAAARKKAKAR